MAKINICFIQFNIHSNFSKNSALNPTPSLSQQKQPETEVGITKRLLVASDSQALRETFLQSQSHRLPHRFSGPKNPNLRHRFSPQFPLVGPSYQSSKQLLHGVRL
jgi:hypothetical protein